MDKTEFIRDMEFNREFNELEYLIYRIYYSCAPTIKGLKPSTMLNFRNMNKIKLFDMWNQNKEFLAKNLKIEFKELKIAKDGVIVLFYNEAYIKKILCKNENECFLRDMGYKNCRAVDFALNELKDKFKNDCPDEIGVFLGYPLDDVKIFSSKNNRACELSRYWKAYTDINNTLSTWQKYDEALEEIMIELSNCKSPLEVL